MIGKIIIEILILWIIYSLYMAVLVHKRGPLGGIFFYPKVMQERVIEIGLMTERELKRRRTFAYILRATAQQRPSANHNIISLYQLKALIPQYKAPMIADNGADNGISCSIFHCFTRTLCHVSFRSSVPGMIHQSDKATQIVSITSQSKNSAPRNRT